MPSVFHHSTVRKRIVYIAVAFCLCLSYLFVNLFRISVLCNEYYKEKVYEEITTTSALKAKRGTIYDTNMNVLATTQTRWRIFVSPREIFLRQKEDKKEYDLVIADGLASILQIEHDNLLNNLRKSCVLDYTVKKAVEEAEYKAHTGMLITLTVLSDTYEE